MFKETLNAMGYQNLVLDDFSMQFLEFTKTLSTDDTVMEVGCGYGILALEIIRHKQKIICNDLDEKHLHHLIQSFNAGDEEYFQPLVGDIRKLPLDNGLLSGIFCSRVFHFFTPEEALATLKNLKNALKIGGKLFLSVETPFLKNWQSFHKTYELNKSKHLKWPAVITTREHEASGRKANLPSFLNLFDIDTLSSLAIDAGLSIERINYVDRSDCFPEDLLLDGRESVTLIARKY